MALSRGSKIFLVILVVVVGLVGGALAWVNHQLSGEPGPGDPVTLEVSSGATAGSIGEVLVEHEVVRNALAFRLVARSKGLDSQLKAGRYELETGMSVDEAIEVLLAGPEGPDEISFRVEEGLTVEQTLQRLAEQTDYEVADFRAVLDARIAAGSNDGDVLQVPNWVPAFGEFGPAVREPFEGLLFPETYRVFADASAQQILQRMLDQLARTMDAIPQERVDALEQAGFGRYDALTMASLIERETRVDDERAVVAGVIRNRLDEGMLLQLDATCLYAINEQKERVLQEDCEVDSPYNTYVTQGLPPTPVSGVGRASLQAAFNPEQTEFRYYVLSPECDGSHAFAETLDEHNRNVAAFRDAGRCL